MTPFEARKMWNQIQSRKRDIENGAYLNEGHRRDLERDIKINENALKLHGRFNAEGKKEKFVAPEPVTQQREPTLNFVSSGPHTRRPRRASNSTRAPNVPNRNVAWGGGTESMRKVVGWGVDTLKRGGCFYTRDVTFEGLRQAMQDQGMDIRDAHDTARHIWLRRGMVDPGEI